MSSRRGLQQVLGLALIVVLTVGCGQAPGETTTAPAAVSPTAPPTASPTAGTISGRVLGDDGRPLTNEFMIVALICSDEDTGAECLDYSFWEMDQDVLVDSVCEAGDSSSDCLLHFGQGAATVQADGSYAITNVPPGEHGIVLMFPALTILAAEYDLSVRAGETTEHDFVMQFHRSD